MKIQETKNKGIASSSILIFVLFLIVIAGLVFSEIYYLDSKSKEEKSQIQSQITTLQIKKKELEDQTNKVKEEIESKGGTVTDNTSQSEE